MPLARRDDRYAVMSHLSPSDLHARRMYTCVVGHNGEIVLHLNLKTQPEELLKAIRPFREQNLVIGMESTFNWYWLADLYQTPGEATFHG